MAECKSTEDGRDCDRDSELLRECSVCRDVWNCTVPAEIFHRKTTQPVCLNCFLTERWLQRTVQNSGQGQTEATQLLRQCERCVIDSSDHVRVLWRFCLKCCQHVCGSSYKDHPCKDKKQVSLSSRTKKCP